MRGVTKKIYQYDLQGNFIREYKSQEQCKFITGCGDETMNRTIEGFKPVFGKFIFTNKFYMKLPKNLLVDKNRKDHKKVYQYDRDGNFIKEWNSVTEVSKFYNVSDVSISSACLQKPRVKAIANSLWRYEKHNKIEPFKDNKLKPVLQYDLNGNFIKEWKCIVDAKKHYKNNSIRPNGRSKTHSGFIWKYKD